jgi:hypothetical protein
MRRRHPRIQPLEIWDAVVGDRTLFEWQRQPEQLPRVLDTLIGQLERGEATFPDDRPSPRHFPKIDRIYLLGGGALSAPMPSRLPERDLAITIAPDPLFAAAAAGATLAPRAVVADVGQTAIKVVFEGKRAHHLRDFAALPLASDLDPDAVAQLRPRFIAFVAGALRTAVGGARAHTVVLALPCALDGDLIAGACSYPYPDPDATLARDVLVAAELASMPALVLNDGELAAYAAACDPRLPAHGTTLVLTLGFGVGAALLRAPE